MYSSKWGWVHLVPPSVFSSSRSPRSDCSPGKWVRQRGKREEKVEKKGRSYWTILRRFRVLLPSLFLSRGLLQMFKSVSANDDVFSTALFSLLAPASSKVHSAEFPCSNFISLLVLLPDRRRKGLSFLSSEIHILFGKFSGTLLRTSGAQNSSSLFVLSSMVPRTGMVSAHFVKHWGDPLKLFLAN